MTDDPLGSALDLPIPTREKSDVVIPENRVEDGEVARRNIHELVVATHDAVREMSDVAWTSQSSRAYEVLGQLIEKGLAANRELLEIEKARRVLDNGDGAKAIDGEVLTGTQALDLVKKKIRDG